VLFRRFESHGEASELVTRGHESLKDASEDVTKCISIALQDAEMLKTKRVKDVLKTAEKLVGFFKAQADPSVLKHLRALKECIEKVESESSGVTKMCEKVAKEIEDCVKEIEPFHDDAKEKLASSKKKKKKGKK
jgi:predicted RND superfamily exporter protein